MASVPISAITPLLVQLPTARSLPEPVTMAPAVGVATGMAPAIAIRVTATGMARAIVTRLTAMAPVTPPFPGLLPIGPPITDTRFLAMAQVTEVPITPLSETVFMPLLPVSIVIVIGTKAD